MYLYRWHCYVKNGRWREFMSVMAEVNRLHKERGFRKMRFWGGVTGVANLFVAEAEYPSLAEWEEETNAISQDAQIMDTLRKTIEYMDATEVHELFVEAPEIA